MKNIVVLAVFIFALLSDSMAQTQKEKTILYLIPFFSEKIEEIEQPINSDADIFAITPFVLAGFWEGALMALQEMEKEEVSLKIVVKDISTDEEKLRSILSDENFMQNIKLIIGPFYADMFLIASQYALQYEIPIINPFSSRSDIIANNPWAYKLTPPQEAQCQDLYNRFCAHDSQCQIILWNSDNESSPEQQMYETFFTVKHVSVQSYPISTDVSTKFSTSKHTVIIAFGNNIPAIMEAFRKIKPGQPVKYTFIIPEKWLEMKEISFDYLNRFNTHFYSDYFINYQSDKTKLFISNYIERFGSIPTLKSFAFQSYDITHYFIRLITNEKKMVTEYAPLSYKFNFTQTEGQGYENQMVRLCEIRDFTIWEIK